MEHDVVLRMLPEVIRQAAVPGSVLDALAAVVVEQHRPPEHVLADLDSWFRPLAAPEAVLPALASWVDLEWVLTGEQQAGRDRFPPGSGRLRDLIERSRELSSWRGTTHGLRSFLEAATGAAGFTVTTSTERPFHFHVGVPPEAVTYLALVERIVAEQGPACATHSVEPIDAVDPSTEGEPA